MHFPKLSTHDALNVALYTLKMLRSEDPCDEGGHGVGRCRAHAYQGEDICPQAQLRVFMDKLMGVGTIPQYTGETLLAVMRGRVIGQEVHVLVRANGHRHRGTLSARPGRLGDGNLFRAELECGDVIDPLDPADVIELGVHFTGKLGQDLTTEDIASINQQIAELATDGQAAPAHEPKQEQP
ncbi:hypothetical protein [Streptomyces sp. NPDC059278]|uniref:hypothetical protein n=1 Tax=Streptomyces sp. NPDC059278 TaxID=3346801 RepID=UPI0036B966ED